MARARRVLATILACAATVLLTAAPTGPVFNNPPRGAAAITSGSITGVSGVPYVWLRYAASPIFIASTGTMGNNGAMSALTALPATYANAWVALPAGAIAAGVPAATDTYFVQMSSTTAGTVFNNRLADNLDANGLPVIPASPTAFSTTGPGAFTGVTAAVTVLTLTLPASTLTAVGGSLDADLQFAYNSTANNKLTSVGFGSATNWANANIASTASARFYGRVTNRSASVQNAQSYFITTGVTGPTESYFAINTAASVSITIAMTHGTATDEAVLESIEFRVTK